MNRDYKQDARNNTPRCYKCKKNICYGCCYQLYDSESSIDHVDGNSNNKKNTNLVMMHKKCNSSKGQKDWRSKLQSVTARLNNGEKCNDCDNN